MKKFSKAEIEGCRDSFREQEYPEITVLLGGREFTYFELPPELNIALPNYCLRVTGEPSDGYVLGVSTDVKKIWRPRPVLHEYIEFMEIGIDTPDRCIRALEEELRYAPHHKAQEYLLMRREFFKNLIPFAENSPEYFTQNDIHEFQQSLNRLEQLVK